VIAEQAAAIRDLRVRVERMERLLSRNSGNRWRGFQRVDLL
jgi:hypothetical protein